MQKATLKASEASNTDLEVLLELNRNYVLIETLCPLSPTRVLSGDHPLF